MAGLEPGVRATIWLMTRERKIVTVAPPAANTRLFPDGARRLRIVEENIAILLEGPLRGLEGKRQVRLDRGEEERAVGQHDAEQQVEGCRAPGTRGAAGRGG